MKVAIIGATTLLPIDVIKKLLEVNEGIGPEIIPFDRIEDVSSDVDLIFNATEHIGIGRDLMKEIIIHPLPVFEEPMFFTDPKIKGYQRPYKFHK